MPPAFARFALFAVLLSLAACTDPPPPLSDAEAAERDSVIAVLRSVDTGTLGKAFGRLSAFRYLVDTRTEQLDAAGDPVGTFTETVAIAPGTDAEVELADSSGAFDFGRFAALIGDDDGDAPLADVVAHSPDGLFLPDEPAYLDPRGREQFHFTFASDTLWGDRRLRVLQVAARPGPGDDQTLRRARLYIDPATNALVGLRLQRRMDSALFSETSDAVVFLQPGPAGGWLPHRTRLDTTTDAPLADPRRFRLTRRYYAFEPAATAGR